MLNRFRKSLFATLIAMLSLIASAMLLFNLENLLFSMSGYRWSGPNDIYFGVLTLTETFLGLWAIIIYTPRKIDKEEIRNIFSGSFPNEVLGYKVAITIGLLAGISFSGIWKIILLATYFY